MHDINPYPKAIIIINKTYRCKFSLATARSSFVKPNALLNTSGINPKTIKLTIEGTNKEPIPRNALGSHHPYPISMLIAQKIPVIITKHTISPFLTSLFTGDFFSLSKNIGIVKIIINTPKMPRNLIEISPPNSTTPSNHVLPLIGGSPTTSKDKNSKTSTGKNKIKQAKEIANNNKIMLICLICNFMVLLIDRYPNKNF